MWVVMKVFMPWKASQPDWVVVQVGVVKKRKLRYETMNISIDKKLSNYEPSWNYKEKGSAERIELDR